MTTDLRPPASDAAPEHPLHVAYRLARRAWTLPRLRDRTDETAGSTAMVADAAAAT